MLYWVVSIQCGLPGFVLASLFINFSGINAGVVTMAAPWRQLDILESPI